MYSILLPNYELEFIGTTHYSHTWKQQRQALALEHRNSMPMMNRLLFDHFRKICEPGAFYSLPLQYVDALGGCEASKALQEPKRSAQQAWGKV